MAKLSIALAKENLSSFLDYAYNKYCGVEIRPFLSLGVVHVRVDMTVNSIDLETIQKLVSDFKVSECSLSAKHDSVYGTFTFKV